MPTVIEDLPEINRRVHFGCQFDPLALPLGCHALGISGVKLTLGSSYYAMNGGKNIEILNPKNAEKIKYPKSYSSGGYTTPEDEYTLVVKYLNEHKEITDGLTEKMYKAAADNGNLTHALFVMSDVINHEAPARKQKLLNIIYETYGSTKGFAEYLIKNKIGYVMASPIVQNQQHRNVANYSLNRAWIWIPPAALERAINVGEVFGEDLFPPKELWLERIARDLGVKDKETVLSRVLNDGVFPSRDPRFTPRRGTDGRFIAREA